MKKEKSNYKNMGERDKLFMSILKSLPLFLLEWSIFLYYLTMLCIVSTCIDNYAMYYHVICKASGVGLITVLIFNLKIVLGRLVLFIVIPVILGLVFLLQWPLSEDIVCENVARNLFVSVLGLTIFISYWIVEKCRDR